jgi:hypothetical protein
METRVMIGGEYSHLIPSLLSKKRSGLVHSIFNNGFNIKMDDSLVFIGNKKSGLLPFGIHLQEDMRFVVPLVKACEPVRWNERTSTLEFPNLTISLMKGENFRNEVLGPKSKRDFQIGFDRLTTLLPAIEQPTGLDIDITGFLKRFQEEDQIENPESEKYLFRLMNAAMSNDTYFIEQTLRYFLGRGKGLTPSGDDLLVGFLAFDSAVHFTSPLFYKTLSDLLENEPITTDVGKEYLKYALKHEFSSSVTDVVNLLGTGNVNVFYEAFVRLLEVGHTSGLDTLLGILTGMLAFNNPLAQRQLNNFGNEGV